MVLRHRSGGSPSRALESSLLVFWAFLFVGKARGGWRLYSVRSRADLPLARSFISGQLHGRRALRLTQCSASCGGGLHERRVRDRDKRYDDFLGASSSCPRAGLLMPMTPSTTSAIAAISSSGRPRFFDEARRRAPQCRLCIGDTIDHLAFSTGSRLRPAPCGRVLR